MIKKLKSTLMAASVLFAVAVPMLAPAAASAADAADPTTVQQGLCAGANLNATDTTCDPTNDTAATDKINGLIKLVINMFSLVVGVVSVIMIIVGGLMYITSAGDSGKVQTAKNTILYAIIGLVIVALSQFIVRFVLTKVTTPA
jgi:cytochrome bd-type quinol oxidase subunit 2